MKKRLSGRRKGTAGALKSRLEMKLASAIHQRQHRVNVRGDTITTPEYRILEKRLKRVVKALNR